MLRGNTRRRDKQCAKIRAGIEQGCAVEGEQRRATDNCALLDPCGRVASALLEQASRNNGNASQSPLGKYGLNGLTIVEVQANAGSSGFGAACAAQ